MLLSTPMRSRFNRPIESETAVAPRAVANTALSRFCGGARLCVVPLLSLGLLGLGGCQSAPQTLRLSTGSSTGYYHRLGKQLEISAAEVVNIDLDIQESKGSIDNLQRLLDGDADLALVQLDVAKESMKSGEVEAIAVLAQEHVHLISRQPAEVVPGESSGRSPESSRDDLPASQSPASQSPASQSPASQSPASKPPASKPPASQSPASQPPANPAISTLQDLQGKTIAVGSLGSGIRFTADEILAAARLDSTSGQIQVNESGFGDALDLLSQRKIDAAFYVGRLGANERLLEAVAQDPSLLLLPISPSLINFIVTQNPGVYRAATIPKGIYGVRPSIPDRELTTLTTPTVLVTRPNANSKAIQRVTWSIVATARRYATFYPELQTGDSAELLRRGLFYLHRDAEMVYDQGDPRQAWIRYWESNSDLQAGIFLLLGTSGLGMLLQHWRRRRAQYLISNTNQRIASISETLQTDPGEALREIEELSQDNRLQFIAGNVPDEIYQQVQQRTQSFNDECRSVIEAHRREQILETLLLLDDWQETLQTDPDAALQKLSQIKQQYRDMLLSNQVDIQAYMELVELTLISVMTLAPKPEQRQAAIAKLGQLQS